MEVPKINSLTKRSFRYLLRICSCSDPVKENETAGIQEFLHLFTRKLRVTVIPTETHEDKTTVISRRRSSKLPMAKILKSILPRTPETKAMRLRLPGTPRTYSGINFSLT